ncbi:MAG: hypothetical protein JSV75_03730 [Candidatus Bathyarchaeota archaeon]|nr:MAG: hypothetical protein JSV75_03730 [Candidatus Bathyarchaeota archaeon]
MEALKLRASRIVDLTIGAMIIVAVVIGGYNYSVGPPSPQLRDAEFQVTDLTFTPAEAIVGQPVTISANVINVGEKEGNYAMNLTINDVLRETQMVQLSGNESRVVEFMVSENNEGSYSVKIGELSGVFIISDVPFPDALEIYEVTLAPFEAWVNETVEISCKARNWGDEALTYTLAYRLDDVVIDTKTIQLSAGEIIDVDPVFCSASSEGTHFVVVGGKTEPLYIVPTGKHTLKVWYGRTDWSFYLNGEDTPADYEELLDVGIYVVEAKFQFQTRSFGILEFRNWRDGELNRTRIVDLNQGYTLLSPEYELIAGDASCPSLYVWNGIRYDYFAEVSTSGYLGYLNYLEADGNPVFWKNYEWDYIKLDKSQLQPRNGYYNLKMIEVWDEIFYLDAAWLLVVDHPSDVDVYSNEGEEYLDPNLMGKIYTVSKNPLTPISAVNEKGEDVLPQISELDGVYASAHNGIYSPSWDNIELNRLELDLGNLSEAEEIKLLATAVLSYGPDEDQGEWYDQFWAQPVPNGTQPIPPPYMEVKDENGTWVRVPESRQFPCMAVTPRTIVVDLTGLFPTDDYSLRISNFWDVAFDYIGVDISSQKEVMTQRIDPAEVSLEQAFIIDAIASGNFTRYGTVTPLVFEADDKFVIGVKGDEVNFKFPANLEPPQENMERDYFLFVSCWFKEDGNPVVDFAVEPLPFYDMSCFPYGSNESYPYDEDHLKYLREYNTREIVSERPSASPWN